MTQMTKSRRSVQTTRLAVTAMVTALITVSTMFIKISTPLGYIHAGDSMVYLAGALLPPPFCFIAAALGGSLADLLSGYAQWALPTAIIKAMNVLPFFAVRLWAAKRNTEPRIISRTNLLMLIPASAVTIGGYFAATTIMYDYAAACGELLTQWIQTAAGAALFIIVGVALDKTGASGKLVRL